jgi:hypothetical protein
MRQETIWERGVRLPQRGPIPWFFLYCSAISAAGYLIWMALGATSPTKPDFASGRVYEVPGGRHAPDFYVAKADAYALRFCAAHFGLVVLVGAVVAVINMGAKGRRPDESPLTYAARSDEALSPEDPSGQSRQS